MSSPVQEVKVCKSFFKKKLSIDDENSPTESRFGQQSSPKGRIEHAVLYFRKALQFGDQSDEVMEEVSDIHVKADSTDAVKLSTS